MAERPRAHAPATLRNREPILDVLRRVLPQSGGTILEIASGTGEHAAYMAPLLPENWRWQPSDIGEEKRADIDSHAEESGSTRIMPAILLDVTAEDWPVAHADAILCCNMIHIAPWGAAEGLFRGATKLLGGGDPLILYGPFKRHGAHTAPSNAEFDKVLRQQNSHWGVRCLDMEVMPLAKECGFDLDEIVQMPANNLTAIFRRR